jgi:hypothetical protein
MTSSVNSPPPALDQALILDKCRSFINFQLWPTEVEAQLEPWLQNFQPSEMEYAYHLLNSFLFFSERMVKQLFSAAVHELSAYIRREGRTAHAERSAWQFFFDNLLVTMVTGEQPSLADSGYMFIRHGRNMLGFREDQLVSNKDALEVLVAGAARSVLFVDDFVGSGSQFIQTWRRKYDLGTLYGMSFERYAARSGKSQFFYCPALCTVTGARAIAAACPQVILRPGNLLGDQYSALNPESIVWPNHLRSNAPDFLETVSKRAGIPDTGGGEDDWRGFRKLALCIAFQHGRPNASLPIFTWDKNGWAPLLRYR